ncbi:eukaryotic aspartyl protease [Ancylostoma duodenale]|uniref:Eukaryotic aspartyl protease n=1 Tax=Ancylostoma duodenale TaxID=51022 RepID=A0A0C2GLC9_9BILA|nr:eukaryotic aspartyl protease [Ancylostoma duodenale]
MKAAWVFLSMLHVGFTLNFTMEVYDWGSLAKNLIATGNYTEYLEKLDKIRYSNLEWKWQGLNDYFDQFYLGVVTVGTPHQVFYLHMDTGSSNMWVIDQACRQRQCTGYPAGYRPKLKFKPGASSTFRKIPQGFHMKYYTGSADGYYGTDTITFAGFFQFFTTTMSYGAMVGYIQYGALDTTHCITAINWVPLSLPKYWQFPIQGFQIGNFVWNSVDQVITDSGASFIGTPMAVFNGILRATNAKYMPAHRMHVVPCAKMWAQPNLIFRISGHQYVIPSHQYVIDMKLGHGYKLAFSEVVTNPHHTLIHNTIEKQNIAETSCD